MTQFKLLGLSGMLALMACAPAATNTAQPVATSTPSNIDSTAPVVALTPAGPTGATLPSGTYQVSEQPGAPAGVTPTGTVKITQGGNGNTRTDVDLRGLRPNTYYVAYYHTQGNTSSAPCASDGTALIASKIVGQTDAEGALGMGGSVSSDVIAQATSFNIHTATGPDGTPADAGVACTSLSSK